MYERSLAPNDKQEIIPSVRSSRGEVAGNFRAGKRVRDLTLCEEELITSFTLFDGHVGPVVFAGIDLIRPEQLVLPQLLEPMRQPAGHARHRENGREAVHLD